jgi:hypothetical protein
MGHAARAPNSGGCVPSLRQSFQFEDFTVNLRDLETKTRKQFVNVDL